MYCLVLCGMVGGLLCLENSSPIPRSRRLFLARLSCWPVRLLHWLNAVAAGQEAVPATVSLDVRFQAAEDEAIRDRLIQVAAIPVVGGAALPHHRVGDITAVEVVFTADEGITLAASMLGGATITADASGLVLTMATVSAFPSVGATIRTLAAVTTMATAIGSPRPAIRPITTATDRIGAQRFS